MLSKLKGVMLDLGLAWQLLTAIPLPLETEPGGRPAGRAAAYFPLVGLILGLLLVGLARLLYALGPAQVAPGLLLVAWVGITGMLHLDGFMDSCDGLLPPRERSRRLEIMKDSRVGAFGVVGVVLLLLLKYNGLLVLTDSLRDVSLLTVPVLGRWAMSWLMARYPLARASGLAVFFGTALGWWQAGVASLVTGVVLIFCWGWLAGLLLLAVTWLTATLVARLAMARLGGLTGDLYGATCEIVEVTLLLVMGGMAAWWPWL